MKEYIKIGIQTLRQAQKEAENDDHSIKLGKLIDELHDILDDLENPHGAY